MVSANPGTTRAQLVVAKREPVGEILIPSALEERDVAVLDLEGAGGSSNVGAARKNAVVAGQPLFSNENWPAWLTLRRSLAANDAGTASADCASCK